MARFIGHLTLYFGFVDNMINIVDDIFYIVANI